MTGVWTAKRLYSAVLSLYPREFRVMFADEMLEDFDDAAEQFGAAWMIRDVLVSVVRQYLSGTHEEAVTAPCGRLLLSGHYPFVSGFEFKLYRLVLAFVLSLALFSTFRPLPSDVPVGSRLALSMNKSHVH